MVLRLGILCWLACAALFAQGTQAAPATASQPAPSGAPATKTAAPPTPVKLLALDPIVFPASDSGIFEFTLSGENLGATADKNEIEIVGRGLQKRADCKQLREFKGGNADNLRGFCLEVPEGMAGRQLTVRGFPPGDYYGPMQVRLHAGGSVSDPVTPITFSAISPSGATLLSLLLFGLLALVIYFLAKKGIAKTQERIIAAFFLDPETNSYSISRFQLLVWLAVLVFSYIYLAVCRLLIQWNFLMPELPDSLSALLAVSAGTTVAAVGATVGRGSKGAGPIGPSWADFVSVGGMVVAERFQFFVWTLVGAGGYLALVLRQNPATFTNLPTVPQGMLYLMGISSAGYLGGKLVRKPGPVVKAVEVNPSTPVGPGSGAPAARGAAELAIRLKGDNLSSAAGFSIDGDSLGQFRFSITGKQAQDQATDPTFCNVVDVTVKDAEKYMEGAHKITIINGDGQTAEATFPVDPIAITSVAPVQHGAGPVQVLGRNFSQGIAATWTDAGKNVTNSDVAIVNPTELQVATAPAAAGDFTLTLNTPAGLRARQKVTVT